MANIDVEAAANGRVAPVNCGRKRELFVKPFKTTAADWRAEGPFVG